MIRPIGIRLHCFVIVSYKARYEMFDGIAEKREDLDEFEEGARAWNPQDSAQHSLKFVVARGNDEISDHVP